MYWHTCTCWQVVFAGFVLFAAEANEMLNWVCYHIRMTYPRCVFVDWNGNWTRTCYLTPVLPHSVFERAVPLYQNQVGFKILMHKAHFHEMVSCYTKNVPQFEIWCRKRIKLITKSNHINCLSVFSVNIFFVLSWFHRAILKQKKASGQQKNGYLKMCLLSWGKLYICRTRS